MPELFHPHLLLFFRRPLIKLVCKSQFWVIQNIIVTFIVQDLAVFIDPEHILELILIEIAVLPFFE